MRTLYFSFIMLISTILTAQSVTGKLVDINNTSLAGLQVKVYTSPSYNTVTTSSDGTFTIANVTGIENNSLPAGYYISNNYPNPFNPKTRINITVPYKSNVKIDIFNILGQDVGRGINKVFEAGENYVLLELNGLPNGVYIARIDIDGKYSLTKKMMLVYGSQHLASSVNYSGNNIQNSTTTTANMLSAITIDSIVVTGTAINRNSFTGLPQITGGSLNVGSLIVNTTTSGFPCPGTPTVTYAGKTYNTIKIGTQCWFKENLNVGTMIDSLANPSNNGKIEKYCYRNDTTNCVIYGGLYQWDEAMQYVTTEGAQGICPTGWHIPTSDGFQTLDEAVNQNGNALKEVGQGTEDGVGTNTSGFSALISGYRITSKFFFNLNISAEYWSSTEYTDPFGAHNIVLMYNNSDIHLTMISNKQFGYSIRCIKDN